MDPAETERLRQALSTQGARVGQHEQVIREIMDTLKNLSTSVSQLGGRLDQVVTQISSLALPGIHKPLQLLLRFLQSPHPVFPVNPTSSLQSDIQVS
ncbi:hypothetical protein ABVT39_019819 [Epinephelus coioides]